MTHKEKNMCNNAVKKAIEITPISALLYEVYTAQEVQKLIENDRKKILSEYAHYLQRIL